MKLRLVLLISLVTFLGGLWSLRVTPTAAGPPDEDDAAALYGRYCGGCHGAQRQGGYGPALVDLGERSDAELSVIIAQGSGGMPGFGEKLGEAEVEAVVSFLKKLSEGRLEKDKAEKASQASTAAVPARLSLDAAPGTDGVIIVRVALQSDDGKPIPEAPITLFRQTVMGGSLPVAEATTDSQGEAILQVAAVKDQTWVLEAAYVGSDNWGPAKAQGKVKLRGTATLPPVISGLTSPTPPPAFAAILVVVVGGVWATYGYVVYQLVRIA
ncbi:MAG: c-type cytochrome, partial [Anaerolineae bacterium]